MRMKRKAEAEGEKKSSSAAFGYVDPGSLKGATRQQTVKVERILVAGQDIEI